MYLTEIHRNEDKNNSAQYEAKIVFDLNLMFPVSLSESNHIVIECFLSSYNY